MVFKDLTPLQRAEIIERAKKAEELLEEAESILQGLPETEYRTAQVGEYAFECPRDGNQLKPMHAASSDYLSAYIAEYNAWDKQCEIWEGEI